MKTKLLRITAAYLAISMLLQSFGPGVAFALTAGPSQPEVQAFEPAGTTDMVDLFSGDFTYNIPLFELPGPNGGYPFNLAYHAGVGMDQEASWVGLGWSLNPGAITRQMRGLPDDFNGENITEEIDMKENHTAGVGGGVSAELFGADWLKGGLGLRVYYNNYKGVGYSIDPSLGLSKSVNEGGTVGMSADISLSLDTQEGVGVNVGATLSNENGMKTTKFNVGLGYNSNSGLSQMSYGISKEKILAGATAIMERKNKKEGKPDTKYISVTNSVATSSTAVIPLGSTAHSPKNNFPMINNNISVVVKAAGAWWGFSGAVYFSGFYTRQALAQKRISRKGYGYLHMENAGNKDMMDFNREKDATIYPETINLAIPSSTYDVFSVSGQGYSAIYRAKRKSVGIVGDPSVISETLGGSIGMDLAPLLAKVGSNAAVNTGENYTGSYKNKDGIDNRYRFKGNELNSLTEEVYFGVHGEQHVSPSANYQSMGGDDAVMLAETRNFKHGKLNSNYQPSYSNERQQRSQIVQSFTNKQIKDGSKVYHNLLKINELNRSHSHYKDDHIAGFIATKPDGLRYVYALPAYNKEEVQHLYTINGDNPPYLDRSKDDRVRVGEGSKKYTNKYKSKKTMPGYAHSYLLTSIVGPDYVDLKNDGVTPDDLGYWVKFTYDKKAEDYVWKSPFVGAGYEKGNLSDVGDDMVSYVQGKKEVWYLSRAETKSHIADFVMSTREDGKSARYDFNGGSISSNSSMSKLDFVKLYARGNSGYSIKKINFDYDYKLCPGTENSIATGKGKLTLRKVKFQYGNSYRGLSNPYVFSYYNESAGYKYQGNDRWGNYKTASDPDFPYVDQYLTKEELDHDASTWNLSNIQTPSGSKINISYEADSYAYVQHLPAMQMMKLCGSNGGSNISFEGNHDNPYVYFKANKSVENLEDARKYLDLKRNQLYFKAKMYMRTSSENGAVDWVSGYVDLDTDRLNDANNGLRIMSNNVVRVPVKSEVANGVKFHPISLRTLQHLRLNNPALASAMGKMKEAGNDGEAAKRVASLVSYLVTIKDMIVGFYKSHKNEWAVNVADGDKAWVRMKNPDGEKFGGGHRVKQITLYDGWGNPQNSQEQSVYGQIYEYTTENENSEIISSGVASNEPQIGADENPLRYGKSFSRQFKLKSDDQLFFEYPINETHFPGPSVGYSKVTVKSLASAAREKLKFEGDDYFPTDISFGTTGKVVNEFYTSRDFPFMTDETPRKRKKRTLPILIPLLGNVNRSHLHMSQGYSIVQNDMHGKPKGMAYFRQNVDGTYHEDAYSYNRHLYHSRSKTYDGENVNELVNYMVKDSEAEHDNIYKVSVDGQGQYQDSNWILGQDEDYVLDMRESSQKTLSAGAHLNVDFLIVPILGTIPVPPTWPDVSKMDMVLKTIVSNKVIHKTAILDKVETYNEGSLIVTENYRWDGLTGGVIMTVVNNNYEDPIYAYTIPAYWHYEGMGAAYKNIDFTFEGSLQDISESDLLLLNSSYTEHLYEGDELMAYAPRSVEDPEQGFKPIGRLIYVNENRLVGIDNIEAQEGLIFRVVRSGYRNQLSQSAGSVTALNDEVYKQKANSAHYSKSILVPKTSN
ncbi:hypothetical protein [Aureibacter tunicatorum]|uniref:Uncharacterized protein n=1 Tax=Aureibacter tunicatorum TaxID=866807 RepID=A0AAE4BTZ7_9BACT|nr:hypothetical protein [Aureibacter tunicatorum]MDR6240475.1 hypothetical protein [Aureibacter tunicatorum]BDD05646.1 hypothetical protein AUTU_31290 [Aureibacter tunicatorum]